MDGTGGRPRRVRLNTTLTLRRSCGCDEREAAHPDPAHAPAPRA